MRPKLVLPLAGLLLLACIGFYPASDGRTPAAGKNPSLNGRPKPIDDDRQQQDNAISR
jgi:hypothetical protein